MHNEAIIIIHDPLPKYFLLKITVNLVCFLMTDFLLLSRVHLLILLSQSPHISQGPSD